MRGHGNRSAILETLLQGCEAGDFVLRVTRADKSVRTFWKSRPDDAATQDSSLEVALSDAVALTELDAALLAPGVLNCLWKTDAITLSDISDYFSGKHIVEVDKGVLEVTDDKALAKAVRKEEQVKHAPHISTEAKLVKLADKICNLRDILASPPADWSAERKRTYFDWAARVVAGLRGVPGAMG